jgi:hypothetical protein
LSSFKKALSPAFLTWKQKDAELRCPHRLAEKLQHEMNLLGMSTQIQMLPSSRSTRMNVIGILHATRALDSECFVFTSRYDDTESYKTVGVHLGLMNYLSNVKWIARDMIWVFTDESQPFSSGIDYWLHDYLFGHDNLHILSPSRVFAVNSTRFESVTSSVRSETTPSSFGSLLRSGRLFGAIALHRVDYDIDFHRFIVFPEVSFRTHS